MMCSVTKVSLCQMVVVGLLFAGCGDSDEGASDNGKDINKNVDTDTDSPEPNTNDGRNVVFDCGKELALETVETALGTVYLVPGFYPSSVTGSGPDDVYFGSGGTAINRPVLHFDGERWSCVSPYTWLEDDYTSFLLSVGEQQVVIADSDGAVHHYQDGKMSEWRSPSRHYDRVWVSDEGVAFAVGRWQNSVTRIEGSSITSVQLETDEGLEDVWGRREDDLYVLTFSTLLNYDGQEWHAILELEDARMSTIWGTADGHLFVGGADGLVMHYDGTEWETTHINGMEGDDPNFSHIEGCAADNVYAFGVVPIPDTPLSQVWHYDGATWSLVEGLSGEYAIAPPTNALLCDGDDVTIVNEETVPLVESHGLVSVVTNGSDDIFALSFMDLDWPELETVLYHDDGSTWRQTAIEPADLWLMSIGVNRNNQVVAVGPMDAIARYDADGLQILSYNACREIVSMWGSGIDNLWAACGNGRGAFMHYDGTTWNYVDSGLADYITALWGSATGELFYVNGHSKIGHFDGAEWTLMDDGTDKGFLSVWGSGPDNVIAVGYSGTIIRYNGEQWSKEYEDGSLGQLISVWGSSADDIYVIGENGMLMYQDGKEWVKREISVNGLEDYEWGVVGGSGSKDVWVLGSIEQNNAITGAMLHLNTTALGEAE